MGSQGSQQHLYHVYVVGLDPDSNWPDLRVGPLVGSLLLPTLWRKYGLRSRGKSQQQQAGRVLLRESGCFQNGRSEKPHAGSSFRVGRY